MVIMRTFVLLLFVYIVDAIRVEYSFEGISSWKEPVLIRGGCNDTIAFQSWSHEYLLKHVQSNVTVEEYASLPMSRDNIDDVLKIPMKEFYELKKTHHVYLYSNLESHLHTDVLGQKNKQPPFVVDAMLIGDRGSGSPYHVHYESDFLLNQFMGEKSISLFYDEWFHGEDDEIEFGDYTVFLLGLPSKSTISATIRAGDSLFVPRKWYHEVVNTETSVSVRFVQKNFIYMPSFFRYVSCRYWNQVENSLIVILLSTIVVQCMKGSQKKTNAQKPVVTKTEGTRA